MPDRAFKPGDIVQHFKRELDNEGTHYLYEIIGTGRNTETHEEYIVYRPLYPTDCTEGVDYAIRPYDMFMSEVDHIKYPDIKQKYRFELYQQ